MKTKLTVLGAVLVALTASIIVFVQPASAAVGLRVNNGRVYEANGSEFIARGVSHAHTWYANQTSSFANIKAKGANLVRVVLGSGKRWGPNGAADVANVISLCKQNRLICMLEVHDTTGYGEEGAAATLDEAVNYWISIKSAMVGQESYVMLNIGNEPFGNNESVSSTWATATSNAIQRLRSNGFEHLIVVDAPMWGQDWRFIMRDSAPTVAAADPQRNTLFSIHMYGVFDTAAEVTSYVDSFRSRNLPLIIGEFGFDHSDGNPDEDTIMSYAQQQRIGYVGWSWSGNGGGVEYLDMVTNFDPNQLTSWGQRIFNGANGIASTAREATVYSGQPQPTTPGPQPTTPGPQPTTPGPQPTTPAPQPGGCSATYTVVGQWQGGFQGNVRVTAGSSAINAWTVRWTFANGQSVSQSWNATVTASGSSVTATNVGYNGRLSAGQSTEFGFIGNWNGTNSVPSVTCSAS